MPPVVTMPTGPSSAESAELACMQVEGHGDDLALEAGRARAHVALEDVHVGEEPEDLVHERRSGRGRRSTWCPSTCRSPRPCPPAVADARGARPRSRCGRAPRTGGRGGRGSGRRRGRRSWVTFLRAVCSPSAVQGGVDRAQRVERGDELLLEWAYRSRGLGSRLDGSGGRPRAGRGPDRRSHRRRAEREQRACARAMVWFGSRNGETGRSRMSASVCAHCRDRAAPPPKTTS